MAPKKIKIALIYDFDGTLAPGNMQEYDFIPKLGLVKKQFWEQVNKSAKNNNADEILTYMNLMLKEARHKDDVKINKEAFRDYGKEVPLFLGVEQWFEEIQKYAKAKSATIEHYIISSGIKEMVEGTKIGKKFKHIFASSFVYDSHNVAQYPAVSVNYTTKTQYIFRINKGIFNNYDNKKINEFISPEKRYIPISNMIYIGDGETDIPCMKVVKSQGGHSISVYKPHTKGARQISEKMIEKERADFMAPADYSEGKGLWNLTTAIIDKIVAQNKVKETRG